MREELPSIQEIELRRRPPDGIIGYMEGFIAALQICRPAMVDTQVINQATAVETSFRVLLGPPPGSIIMVRNDA